MTGEREAEYTTSVDARTGLPTRSIFLQHLTRRIGAAHQQGESLGVLGLDPDHVAYINYAYGPAAGDAALGATATILRSVFHHDEVLCRFGGNAFYALLPTLSWPDVLQIAERLRQAAVVIDLVAPQPHAPRRCLTFSIGVASYPEDGETLASLLDTVACGIAAAKGSGRNTVRHVVR